MRLLFPLFWINIHVFCYESVQLYGKVGPMAFILYNEEWTQAYETLYIHSSSVLVYTVYANKQQNRQTLRLCEMPDM